MSWRVVVISTNSKLDLKLNYLVVRNTEIRKVHLSEISVLMIESTAVSITSMLLCELIRRKVKIIFCDEQHNPYGELMPYHGCHDSPDKLRIQIKWDDERKSEVWRRIVQEKIKNQALILSTIDDCRSQMLLKYVDEVLPYDSSNREGHAAKVYFNTLFGDDYSRRDDCIINSCLNYGYSIILSAVNREISALGYSTELGIFHDNTYNHYNLGSDLMEPFRPFVDMCVLNLSPTAFNSECKKKLIDILNIATSIDGRKMHLIDALPIYVKSITDSLSDGIFDKMRFCKYEGTCDEIDCLL